MLLVVVPGREVELIEMRAKPYFLAAASSTRRPSGTTSLPMPSPGMTAIRYCFLLIENVPFGPAAAVFLTALQWTKLPAVQRCTAMLTDGAANRLLISSLFLTSRVPPMDLHLRGKRVLITGASKGIGAAAAEAFAEEGAHLLLAARNGEQLKALARSLALGASDRAPRPSSTCAKPRIWHGSPRKPPISTSSSTMPATFPAARSTRSTRRPGVTPGS